MVRSSSVLESASSVCAWASGRQAEEPDRAGAGCGIGMVEQFLCSVDRAVGGAGC